MIHGNSLLRVLNISDKNSEARDISVSKLFTEFYHLSDKVSEIYEYIDFPRTGIQLDVRDMNGWTQLIRIDKMKKNEYMSMLTVGSNNVLITIDELVPLYENNPVKGFHGEMKYPYTLCSAGLIKSGRFSDMLCRVIIDTTDTLLHTNVIKRYTAVNEVYRIIVKSRFYNCNNIYLLGSDEITVDELYEMSK